MSVFRWPARGRRPCLAFHRARWLGDGQIEAHHRVGRPAGERGLARRDEARLDDFLPQTDPDGDPAGVTSASNPDRNASRVANVVFSVDEHELTPAAHAESRA